MALLAYDGASAFDLDAAKRAGGIAVTGYTIGHPGGFDPISKDRVDTARSKGLGVWPNAEGPADFLATCTPAQAQVMAANALAAATALGFPTNKTISYPFSWDVNIPRANYGKCADNARAVIQGLGDKFLFTAYAQGGLIDYFKSQGLLQAKGWLSASSSWPGFNPKSPNIAMVQSHDADGNWINTAVPGTDVNTVIDPHALGAWWPANSPYGGSVSATGPEKWDAKDWAAFDGHVWGHGVKNPISGVTESAQTRLLEIAFSVTGAKTGKDWNKTSFPNNLNALAAQLSTVAQKVGALNPQAFAAQLAPLMIAALPQGPVTQEQLVAALTTVLGSVDNDPAGGTP